MTTTPPFAEKIDFEMTHHGDTRNDVYHWMRAENWEEVLKTPKALDNKRREYLEAENAYTKSHMDACQKLTDTIGDELAARIIPNDSSVPSKHGDWEYWVDFRPQGNYPVYRRRHLETAEVQIIFDGDKEAEGKDFYDIHQVTHSPDHRYMTYAVDREGSEYYNIRIREILTGKEFTETVKKTSGYCVWAPDSSCFYYVELDNNHKPKKIKCHILNTPSKDDVLMYHEKDDGYFLNVGKSNSKEYIFIVSGNSETTEVQFFDAAKNGKDAELKLVRAREAGVEYSLHHRGDYFYIHTNLGGATEFKIMRTLVDQFEDTNWTDFYVPKDGITLESIDTLKTHMIREERANALTHVVVDNYNGQTYRVEMPDAAFELSSATGYEFDAKSFRIHYDTMAHPGIVFEVDLKTGEKKIIKERKLPNGHDASEYLVERAYINARDGAEVPATILRHKSVKADGRAPLHVYGYGSYGISSPSGFSKNAISLVDRGIVYAVAHIRGSNDKGESWHKDGKKLSKKNTFNDFIDVAEGLINMGYGKAGHVTIEGRSAGGMLMGAVVNMRPDLFGMVIAGVAFVDVLTTILDDTLPLTPPEWEEWGNPITDPEYYSYMKSYSPYDNIQKGVDYPMILAPAGLTDPRVTYWEPAKWIARLRDEAKGGPFLLKMNMGSGHFGTTGRYDQVRERADEYALLVHTLENQGYDMSVRVDYDAKSSSAKSY